MTGPDNEKGSEIAEYVKVGKLGDFPAGAIRPVTLGEEPVAVANVLGRLYCFSNYCTHVGLELSSGYLSEGSVTCLYHGSEFDLGTGEAVGGPAQAPVTLYSVRVEGDDVLVARD